MITVRSRSVLACLALAGAIGGCGARSGEKDYEGVAYPNHRPQFEGGDHLLGYVANRMSDSISVLDLNDVRELGRAPVGIDPVDVDGPRHIAIDPAGGYAYVVLSYPLSVTSPHVAAAGQVSRAGYVQQLTLGDLAPIGEARVDPRAADLAMPADLSQIAVAHFDQDLSLKMSDDIDDRRANLALIAPPAEIASEAATTRSVRVCVAPIAAVYANGNARAYVACTGEDALVVVDTENATVLARVPAGDASVNKPLALSSDASATRLFLSNEVSSQVVVFSAEDTPTQLFASAPLDGVPYTAGSLSATEFAVPLRAAEGAASAARLDATSGELLSETRYPHDLCLNPSEIKASASGRVFMVCEGDHYTPGSVLELDRSSLEALASTEVGLYPDHLALREP
jgi:DNA-binding beta-propeller fold protein YncE